MFFQRSESPRNISGSSKIWDLCCMLNHFTAKLPKIDDWKARAQYMYRDWRPGKSQTCRRLCVRLGDSLHRAESPLHVWGKGHPVQKATPVPQARPKYGPNSLKSKRDGKNIQRGAPPRGRIWSMRTKVRPQFTYSFRIDELSPTVGGEGPRAEGGRREGNLPQ